MKEIDVNSDAIAQSVAALKSLANPIRLAIAQLLLGHDELNVSAIQEHLNLPQSSVSQHITKMREANIVESRREGNRVYYWLPCVLTTRIVKLLNEYFNEA